VWPMRIDVAGVHIALTRAYKPLSWVWLALLVAFLFSPPVRRVMRDRSVAGFYALSALALWILSLGPTVRLMGHRLWYKAPYAWLYFLPGSEAVRVPARIWMLSVLCLAVVTAYGLMKLRRSRAGWARAASVFAGAFLVIEAWPGGLPLPSPPDRLPSLEAAGPSVPVLELPLDSPGPNLAAMYRSMYHGRPIINGYSGFDPPWYPYLVVGLTLGDEGALAPFAERTAFDVVVHHAADTGAGLAAVVERAGGRPTERADSFALYRIPERPALQEPPASPRASVAQIVHGGLGDITRRMRDAEFTSPVEPRDLEIVLARPCQVDEIQLGVSPGLAGLTVVAEDAVRPTLWAGSVAERGVRAALIDPRHPWLRLRFPPVQVDRLRILPRLAPGPSDTVVTGVAVFGPTCSR
jgi:hypothetical protein